MTEHRNWPPTTADDKAHAVRLAAGFYQQRGACEQAVRDAYGTALPSMIRFWQLIHTVITEEDVIMRAPIEVRRLRARYHTPEQQDALRRARRITRERAW